eukprot:TRINITY_DN110607_c0_g1_i1.p1 TRINITY_DN110607_c0_g1~~TRINITY_DN110607_c0_g1_i1.p1  ORF type:complete len:483 (-),score=96.89 TRINITY_DN110607_c0_g1_i1:211-1659(-)
MVLVSRVGQFAVVAAALVLGALFGKEVVPDPNESVVTYTSRILRRSEQVAQEVYAKALLVLPVSYQVGQGRSDSSVDLTFGDSSKTHSSDSMEERAREKADKLVQKMAENEVEIDAQQKVSAKRYAELKKAQEEQEKSRGAEEELSMPLPPPQPDEVRSKMPRVARNGPEMRCGQAIPAESRLTTRNVEIHVKSQFEGTQRGQYHWSYFVTFKNRGEETVQMLTRHWIFVDALGRLESEVKGPGARGVTPVLPPQGEWTYTSGTSLPTPYGSMHGSFQFEVLKSDTSASQGSFSGRVGRLLLSSSNDGSRKDVPCEDEAQEGLLPATSVLSTERVILGGRGDFTTRKAAPSSQKSVAKNGKSYYFAYDVQINNARDMDIEVIGHLWEVIDSKGRRHTVAEGSGVGGVYMSRTRPLTAGDAFRTQGEIASPTKEANAQGTYRVLLHHKGGKKSEIQVRTDFFGLSAKKDVTHVANFVADPNFR